MSETTTTEKPKAKLNKATSLLFHVAARSHTLRDFLGIEHKDDCTIRFIPMPRPWLVKSVFCNEGELAFDADKFSAKLGRCSDGEEHMVLWLLNVWNPGYAKRQGWTFDLFRALNVLDQENREAIAWWLENPIWP